MDTRNDKGQFIKGNPGGPGRPKYETERTYLQIVIAACPPETWAEIVARAVMEAKAGDSKAREWLSSYLIGRAGHPAPSLKEAALEQYTGAPEISDMDLAIDSLT
jgi:hypothetical protein